MLRIAKMPVQEASLPMRSATPQTCVFCGIESTAVVPREDAMDRAVACCPTCHCARHLASLDESKWVLAWLPGVPQAMVTHQMRICAFVVRRLIPGIEPRAAGSIDSVLSGSIVENVVREILPDPHWLAAQDVHAELVSAASRVSSVFVDRCGTDVFSGLAAMNEKASSALLSSLRLVPKDLATMERDMPDDEDGMLAGFTKEYLDRAGWFEGELRELGDGR